MKYSKEQITEARNAVKEFAEATVNEELNGTPKSLSEQADAFSSIVEVLINKIKEL
jgi:hypothetical protein